MVGVRSGDIEFFGGMKLEENNVRRMLLLE